MARRDGMQKCDEKSLAAGEAMLSVPPMRRLWLMIISLGILSGMMLRAMPLHHCDTCSHSHPAEHHDDHSRGDSGSEVVDHDEHRSGRGGSGHAPDHHHFCCSFGGMMIEVGQFDGFRALEMARPELLGDVKRAPEDPVFELDTPPLI
jgi:hypothetical protein